MEQVLEALAEKGLVVRLNDPPVVPWFSFDLLYAAVPTAREREDVAEGVEQQPRGGGGGGSSSSSSSSGSNSNSNRTAPPQFARVGFIQCVVVPQLGSSPRLHVEAVRAARLSDLRDKNHVQIALVPIMGMAVILGLLVMLEARSRGIFEVYGLAIDDEERQHERLTRFMRRSGAKDVRYVGDGVESLPDRLVWGGRGMLMKIDPVAAIAKYEPLFQRWARSPAAPTSQAASA